MHLRRILDHEYADQIPLGINVESVSINRDEIDASVDLFDPDESNQTDARHRYIFGGAHWNQWGRGRVGVVVTLQQVFRAVNSDRSESRLLAQTHVEF